MIHIPSPTLTGTASNGRPYLMFASRASIGEKDACIGRFHDSIQRLQEFAESKGCSKAEWREPLCEYVDGESYVIYARVAFLGLTENDFPGWNK